MRCPLLSCLLATGICLASAASAQASPDVPPASSAPTATPSAPTGHKATEAVKKELTAIIEAQLAAFRADDYPKAFSFASAELRSLFAPAEFERMVKAAYPVIAHSESAEYGMAFDTGEEAVINVRVQDAAKRSLEYHYLFKKEPTGWKIGGVTEVKAEGLSV